jgi:hypothetical protein
MEQKKTMKEKKSIEVYLHEVQQGLAHLFHPAYLLVRQNQVHPGNQYLQVLL